MHDHARNIYIHTMPPSTERAPLLIVGDVHGCAAELDELIKKAKQKLSQFQLVLVGDLFTKGPDPVGVYELAREHNAICIKGNHDWALWASILSAQKRGVQSMPEHTQQTLHLIRFHRRQILNFIATLPHAITSTVVPQVPRPNWEKEYPLTVVHAGIDPTKGLQNSSERVLLTVRYVRWEPDSESGEKKMALVPLGFRAEMLGMQPSSKGAVEMADGDQNKVTNEERFHWHDLHQGPELIVFGHDAKQGLFRKTLPNHRPICVGIDTGCTYGRCLTGYIPELDDAIQVPAKRAYFDISKNLILTKPPAAQLAI